MPKFCPSTLLAIGFYPIGFELNLYKPISIWDRIAIFITANQHLGQKVQQCLLLKNNKIYSAMESK